MLSFISPPRIGEVVSKVADLYATMIGDRLDKNLHDPIGTCRRGESR